MVLCDSFFFFLINRQCFRAVLGLEKIEPTRQEFPGPPCLPTNGSPTIHVRAGLVHLFQLMTNTDSHREPEPRVPSGSLSVLSAWGVWTHAVSCLLQDRVTALEFPCAPTLGSHCTGDISRPPGEFMQWTDMGNGSDPPWREPQRVPTGPGSGLPAFSG